MLPNGTWISINSSNFDIHNQFGLQWLTNNWTSLFTYPQQLSWKDYHNPVFVPNFNSPPYYPECGNNQECAYDVMVTGNFEIGISNIIVTDRQEKQQNFYENLTMFHITKNPEIQLPEKATPQPSFSVEIKSGSFIIFACFLAYFWLFFTPC